MHLKVILDNLKMEIPEQIINCKDAQIALCILEEFNDELDRYYVVR
jgi:hypothetical protein